MSYENHTSTRLYASLSAPFETDRADFERRVVVRVYYQMTKFYPGKNGLVCPYRLMAEKSIAASDNYRVRATLSHIDEHRGIGEATIGCVTIP